MATAVLTNVPATLDLAETTTDWNGDTFSLEPDIKVQGSNSVACAQTSSGNNDVYVDGFTAANLSTVHLRLWFNISYVGYLSATNPCQIFISDGTNTAYWDYDISDYGGGWRQAVVYTGDTPLSGTKPTGNTTEVGIRFVTSSKPRNVPANAWYDAWYYGDGYTITGGTSGDEIGWSHIAALDLIEAYGIVTATKGIYSLAGHIQVGSATTTWFKSEGDICVFDDLPVASGLYELEFYGTGCRVEIVGGVMSAAGAQNFSLACDMPLLAAFSFSGVQVSKASDLLFETGSVTNTVFDKCGWLTANGCTLESITISNPASARAMLVTTNGDIANYSNISFIGYAGVAFGALYFTDTVTGSLTLNNFIFDTPTATDSLYWDATGGTLTVNKGGTTNIGVDAWSSDGGIVDIPAASVGVSVTVLDKSTGSPIANVAHVMLHLSSDHSTVIISSATNASGVASTSYEYGGDVAIDGWVRQWDLSGDDYTPQDVAGEITADGFNITVNLEPI